MSAADLRRLAAVRRRQRECAIRSISRVAAILLTSATLAACASAPPTPIAGADPADPSVRVAGVGYQSSVTPYQSRRPTGPSDWGEMNRRVAPQPKP